MPAGLTVFLDLDGTVLDTTRRNFEVHRFIAHELGGRISHSPDALWQLKRTGQSSRAIFTHENPTADAVQFGQRWRQEIESPRWLELDTVQTGVLSFLQDLALQCTVVIVTLRQDRAALKAQLDKLQLTPFLYRILSADPGVGVGAELKYQLIASQDFSSGVIVGDTEIDIRAGKLAGIGTIAVETGIRDTTALEAEHPNLILPRLPVLTLEQIAAIARPPRFQTHHV